MKSDVKNILQRGYCTTILHKTHNKIEEIIFHGFVVACEPFRSGVPHAYFGGPCTPVEER